MFRAARPLLEKLDAGLPPLPPGDECRIWTLTTNKYGYGLLWHEGHHLYAHRVLWEREHGVTLTPKQHICHRCDNPPCVRLSHLFIGDAKLNMQDAGLKGRMNKPVWTKLTLEKARAIRAAGALIPLDSVRCFPGKSSPRLKALSELAVQFGVHPFTIQRILQNRRWKEPLKYL